MSIASCRRRHVARHQKAFSDQVLHSWPPISNIARADSARSAKRSSASLPGLFARRNDCAQRRRQCSPTPTMRPSNVYLFGSLYRRRAGELPAPAYRQQTRDARLPFAARLSRFPAAAARRRQSDCRSDPFRRRRAAVAPASRPALVTLRLCGMAARYFGGRSSACRGAGRAPGVLHRRSFGSNGPVRRAPVSAAAQADLPDERLFSDRGRSATGAIRSSAPRRPSGRCCSSGRRSSIKASGPQQQTCGKHRTARAIRRPFVDATSRLRCTVTSSCALRGDCAGAAQAARGGKPHGSMTMASNWQRG